MEGRPPTPFLPRPFILIFPPLLLCLSAGFLTCTAFLADALDSIGSANLLDSTGFTQARLPVWGQDVHVLSIQHQILNGSLLQCLSNRQAAHGGDDSTVNVGAMSLTMGGAFTQTAGPSVRQIFDMANLDNSRFVIPMGQDGNILSSNYDTMLPKWAAGQYELMVSTFGVAQLDAWDVQTLLN